MKHYGLVLALSVAGCTHVLLYVLINLWPAPEPEARTSIPVTLVVSQESAPSVASTPSSSTDSAKSGIEQDIVATTKESFNSTLQASPKTAGKSETQETSESERAAQRRSESRRNQAASIRQIFSNDIPDQQQLPVITDSAPRIMSQYEQQLLAHLLEGELYDQFHRFMLSNRASEVSFSLQLTLFSNGAIKGAKLLEKNKPLAIDRLAITAAYNASPYPRPPDGDAETGFNYVVSMTYDGRSLK